MKVLIENILQIIFSKEVATLAASILIVLIVAKKLGSKVLAVILVIFLFGNQIANVLKKNDWAGVGKGVEKASSLMQNKALEVINSDLERKKEQEKAEELRRKELLQKKNKALLQKKQESTAYTRAYDLFYAVFVENTIAWVLGSTFIMFAIQYYFNVKNFKGLTPFNDASHTWQKWAIFDYVGYKTVFMVMVVVAVWL